MYIFIKKNILPLISGLPRVIVVSCCHSISRIAQSVLATPTTIHFVEISGWSTHDTMNYSDAPAKLDGLQTSHGFLKCRKNSRAELVPSPRAYARNGASRRWLGDHITTFIGNSKHV